MSKEKMIRLSQIARKLDMKVLEVCEKLAKMGIEVENNPNFKVPEYYLLKLSSYERNKSIPPADEDELVPRVSVDEEVVAITTADWGIDINAQVPGRINRGRSISRNSADHLDLELVIPDDFSEEEIENLVAEFVVHLDNSYRALGGKGLKVENLQRLLVQQLEEVWS